MKEINLICGQANFALSQKNKYLDQKMNFMIIDMLELILLEVRY